mmetsp:Transcript_35520/g.36187  ORF Transcript_35520/g.36187 Transcript_35520/m.36187 type:complete len:207 (+) Transcript_35520:261-881(+)
MSSFSDPQILHSQPNRIQRCEFSGHACNISSVYQAREIIADVRRITASDSSPFAFRVVEDDKLHEIFEDCGEFICGTILLKMMQVQNISNAIVIVSKKVYGCFVTDMIQQSKLVAVKKTCGDALKLLRQSREKDEHSHQQNRPKSTRKTIKSRDSNENLNMENTQDGNPRIEKPRASVVTIDPNDCGFVLEKHTKIGRPGHFLDKR